MKRARLFGTTAGWTVFVDRTEAMQVTLPSPRKGKTHGFRTIIGALTLSACVLLLATACDPAEFARVENRSDMPVRVFIGPAGQDILFPRETARYVIIYFDDTQRLEVKSFRGDVLYSRTYTWDEIHKEGGLTIIVE